MSRQQSLGSLVTMALLAAGMAGVSAQVKPASSTLTIIVNRQNPTVELTIGDLRRMFLGEVTHWPDGRRITVVMRNPGEPERNAMLRLICRMTERDFARQILHAEFKGEYHGGPKLLDTAAGVRRFLFNVPGAIGYVRDDELDGSVKALRIGGPIPEPGFGFALRAR
jgi:ABC-type phosphate transport system substrate-binding protein